MKEEVTYVDIEAWGRTAELVGQYLTKGRSAFVEGRLRMDSWEDKQTGARRNKLKIVAENVQFLGGRGGDGAPSDGGSSAPAAQRPAPAPRQEAPPAYDDDEPPF